MTEGLKSINYAILRQEIDQLEWCTLTLPIPCKVGLPCSPCELPNEYYLYQSNENYSEVGMKIYDFQEKTTCLKRTLCMPSMRGFTMEVNDFYNNLPFTAEKPVSIPCFKNSKPEMKVYFEGNYIGKIVEPKSLTCCQGKFHEIKIYNKDDEIIYNIEAKLNQNMCLWISDKYIDNQITYNIYDNEDEINSIGEIKHLFFGLYNEACSKADQYGITYPENANSIEKGLITMATVFIDYQWFENS